jgi:hypothetical protein
MNTKRNGIGIADIGLFGCKGIIRYFCRTKRGRIKECGLSRISFAYQPNFYHIWLTKFVKLIYISLSVSSLYIDLVGVKQFFKVYTPIKLLFLVIRDK